MATRRDLSRSIRARFRTRMATASAICRVLSTSGLSCRPWASTRSGSRPSTLHRWPTSATTSPIIAISIRSSGRSPTSIACLQRPTPRSQIDPRLRAESYFGPASLVSSRAALRATIRNATGISGAMTQPNNWLSNFGGPAWEWDATTGQYYYHSFLNEQPDLNWRNPEVRTRCSTSCASGSIAASMVFAST